MTAVAATLLEPATLEWSRTAALGILGHGLLAGVVTAVLAATYRTGTRLRLADGPAILAGLSVPATALLVGLSRHGTLVADTPPTHHATGTYLLSIVAVGTALGTVGARIGDHVACDAVGVDRVDPTGDAANQLRAARRSVAVELPSTIDDTAGYPVVDAAVKRRLEGRTLLFPRRTTVQERRKRLQHRLATDFDLGYVEAELDDSGRVESLAVGDRRRGLGPTLPPGTVAVPIRTDCATTQGVGDPVEIWASGDDSRFVTTGSVRGQSGSTATVVVDAEAVDTLAFERGYRLTVGRERPSGAGALVTALHRVDETIVRWTVDPDGPLEHEFAGWVPGRVLAIDRDGATLALPAATEPVTAGDTLYVFGTPAELRDLSCCAGNSDESHSGDDPRSRAASR